MNIVEKMKKDWDRRASHDVRYWIATEDYRTDDVFDRSGEATARAIVALVQRAGACGDVSRFRALEIGCGIGRVLKPMASHVREVVGVDVSREMIARSEEWLEGLSNATARESSGVDLEGLDDASFELVYSYVAFQHMPRPVFASYLSEAHRVLRAGGWLVFQTYIGPRHEPPLGDTISLRVYDDSELEARLQENGFHVEERRLEHRTPEGLASWLVLAARDDGMGERSAHPEWVGEECGDLRSPMDDHLYRNLARNQIAEGRRDEAIETMRRHLEFDSGELSVALELAAVLVEAKRTDEAIEVLDAVTNVHPDYSDAYLGLVQLLAMVGRRSEAGDVIDRLQAAFPEDRALHERARQALAQAPTAPRR